MPLPLCARAATTMSSSDRVVLALLDRIDDLAAEVAGLRNLHRSSGEVPSWLQGVWHREYIKQTFRPPKRIDSDNRVRYVQAKHLCADVRFTSPNAASSKGLAALSVTELKELAKVECFAGCTQVHLDAAGREVVSWFPIFQFPPDPSADPVRLWAALSKGRLETEDKVRKVSATSAPTTHWAGTDWPLTIPSIWRG